MAAVQAVMVTPNLTLGGAERWIVDLIKHSDPNEVKWVGCALSNHGGCDLGLSQELSAHTRLVTNRLPQRAAGSFVFDWTYIHAVTGPDFREAIKEAAQGAEVLVTWGATDTLEYYRHYKIPRVFCSHSTRKEEANIPVTGMTHLVGVSTAALAYFTGRKGADQLPKTVIYNGADPVRVTASNPREKIRTDWGVPPDAVVIGYLGRQSPEKNPLAAAMAVQHSDYHVVFHGCGVKGERFDGSLQTWCHQHIPGRWRMFPPWTNVGDLLHGFDLLILPSYREAFSLTLIEAWMAGVPVVATPVGSLPELQATYGPLVYEIPIDPQEPELRHAVELALGCGRQSSIVQRAQALARQEFTIQAMAKRWAVYLRAVVEGRI